MSFFHDDFVIPNNIRAFFQFKGSKVQHITEAAISNEMNCFQANIPSKYFFSWHVLILKLLACIAQQDLNFTKTLNTS